MNYESYVGLMLNMPRVHAMKTALPTVYALTALLSGVPSMPLADASCSSEEEAEMIIERHKVYKKEQDRRT